jgi:hypothetical protein
MQRCLSDRQSSVGIEWQQRSCHTQSLAAKAGMHAQAPCVAGPKGLLKAEARAAALAAALREREACLSASQAALLQAEARHAQACGPTCRT